MDKVPEKHRVCLRTPRGAGKSCMASLVVLWFGLTREALEIDWKVCVTAGVANQLREYFWPEIKKWSKCLRWDRIGRNPFNAKSELLTDALHLQSGRAFCVSPESPSLIEGAHAKQLMVVLDESKIIPDGIFDAVEGMFSGAGAGTNEEAYALMISTPGAPNGRFYEVQARKPQYIDWYADHVEVEEMLAAGRITKEFIEMRKLQWGETSALYQQHLLVRFAADDKEATVPLAWVEAAIARWEAEQTSPLID